ncbi:PREDICTED: biliverdin reductase A [Gekko japonicus]|uniref:Biliverdin reductase A n=1 Tax=Gekko japonicus TaxID=146911 RepID=A0ABM1JXK0_GEKJA|nr:PREDICTED: biliverdin reductase A [Gekko japonicus]
MFGTVVVGVGIAGSVRIRDLLNPLSSSPAEHLKLVGFVSRRPLSDVQQANQISLQEALDNQEVHAAVISTDNKNHEESIRMFLEAGKHVLVEYPMALSAKAAHQLWAMADQKGGPLDEERSGFPAFSGIARLTWLVDLFGNLTVVSAAREEQKEKNYSRMTVQFQTANKRPLTWIEERAPGMKRDKTVNFCFKSGCLESLPEAPRAAVGLFMQDLILFAKKLLGQVSKDELAAEKRRILRCLDLADEIQAHCEQTPKIYS